MYRSLFPPLFRSSALSGDLPARDCCWLATPVAVPRLLHHHCNNNKEWMDGWVEGGSQWKRGREETLRWGQVPLGYGRLPVPTSGQVEQQLRNAGYTLFLKHPTKLLPSCSIFWMKCYQFPFTLSYGVLLISCIGINYFRLLRLARRGTKLLEKLWSWRRPLPLFERQSVIDRRPHQW